MKTIVLACAVLALAACSGGGVDDVVPDLGPDAAHDAAAGDMGIDAPGHDAGVDAPASDAGVDASDAAPPADSGPADAGPPGTLCTSTGGTVETIGCCAMVPDFPDTCAIGACSCSPMYSHPTMVCTCPTSQCYDPIRGCTPRTTP